MGRLLQPCQLKVVGLHTDWSLPRRLDGLTRLYRGVMRLDKGYIRAIKGIRIRVPSRGPSYCPLRLSALLVFKTMLVHRKSHEQLHEHVGI